MQLLSKLIHDSGVQVELRGDASVAIRTITADSREVTPGSLFVAMPGVKVNGAAFVAEACAKGAVALLLAKDADVSVPAHIVQIRTSDVRLTISKLAAAFYPKKPEFCFAITGTDGKTSTADFVRQLAQLSGMDSASIGTLGLRSNHSQLDAAFPANNTSPEPILLHKTLQQLCEAKVQVVAIETSSHGLDQKRADGVKFAAAAFTNLTRDHLDYHGTLEKYFAAKARLFSEVLGAGKLAVLNRDDAHFAALKSLCDARSIKVISFGYHADADYRITRVTPHSHGLDAALVLQGKEYTLSLPLYGAFQLSNMLVAMGLLTAVYEAQAVTRGSPLPLAGRAREGGVRFSAQLHTPPSNLPPQGGKASPAVPLEASSQAEFVARMVALLPKLTGVPGRLEKVASANGAPVFIDYAHTPAALENILKTLRPHTAKKLHVVFGCGGDRDAGKRPEMGAVAAKYADEVIVTDDNPRSENAAAIRAAILACAPAAKEIPDRDAAIRMAIQQLNPGDVLVVAGKGHETTQIIGNQTLPFNDAEHIRKAVAA